MEAIFQGKRSLFKGLAIDSKPYDWKEYPVIHLNFTDCAATNANSLAAYLDDAIQAIADSHFITLKGHELPSRFSSLITSMDKGNGVVVLVDEYDKPLLNNLADEPAMQEILPVIKGFYSAIKACGDHERFVFVTGITKFCHVSLFSDLNNLQDITMNPDYATMMGYTQSEFEAYFKEWIADAESRQSLSHHDYLAQIKSWYDGYRFEENAESVYNPVSLASFFTNNYKFSNYWFETGTPAFLIQLVQTRHFDFTNLQAEPVAAAAFNAFEIDDIDPVTLLYQTGYLTIHSTELIYGSTYYWLDFPNREVSESFSSRILKAYSKRTQREVANFCTHLSNAMISGNLAKF